MDLDHHVQMRFAIEEAERARGTTGDNPWVGCAIVDARGLVIGRGHTLGPGEDHAEVAAARDAESRGFDVAGATLYSTLEPCSFHGRTPACARAIANRKIRRVVTAMRDPNPRVDGEGVRILLDAGLEVIEGILESEVRRQLGPWVIRVHPHDPRKRARELATRMAPSEVIATLAQLYAVDEEVIAELLA